MIIVGVVAGVLVLGAALAWVVVRSDVPGTPPAVATQSARALPPGPIGPADLRRVRFDQALRGYRAEQVDDTISRLAEELAARDEEIARLRDEDRSTRVPGRGAPGAEPGPTAGGDEA